ncbi:MAG: NAD-dependent deacylase [Sphingomonadaceae bacterium]
MSSSLARPDSRIVILTGAGVSAESGVPTFRDADGLWEEHRVEEVATPQAFRQNPALVQNFYDQRRAALARTAPNPAHLALARLDAEWEGSLLLVTQNVDDLHERAGSERLLHMHGELLSAWCLACDARSPWDAPLGDNPACPGCGEAKLRPDIVWFGEMPYHMEEIEDALASADLFIAIGTSGQVYPAAGFVDLATQAGAHTIEVNVQQTSSRFAEHRTGPAGEIVPALVAELLGC